MLYIIEWTENGIEKALSFNSYKQLEDYARRQGINTFGHTESSLVVTLRKKLSGDYNCVAATS